MNSTRTGVGDTRIRKVGAARLRDFTVTWRVIPISLLAIAIAVLSTFVAAALLQLIAGFTNLFFFQRWSSAPASPAANMLGGWEVLVPIAGALIIGCMARFGSERIRGHGIPEALEAILIRGSRVEPKVALLKPLSAAISIGSGGPFGAEGPIIMTGGAFGSLVAQFFHLTSTERKTLLVAGAAAGMSATFAAPVAAVMLAVELLLFEWKPRSFIPVALASAAAAFLRRYLLGAGPLFPVPTHTAFLGPLGLLACLGVGVLAGGFSALLTLSVYGFEDLFKKLPCHWMWWPAIGGLVIGIGGLIHPRALGVGYDTIGALLNGELPPGEILLLIVVKWAIWSCALGSGTSGGVLAPLLMMGGALGGLEALVLPNGGCGFWPLVSMGAILGGTMRSPFTGIIFTLELTDDQHALLPLLVAVCTAHLFTSLLLRRSILTEKVERRGYHVTREYAIDPLEVLFVREAMRSTVCVLSGALRFDEALRVAESRDERRMQRLFPVVDAAHNLLGVVTERDLRARAGSPTPEGAAATLDGLSFPTPVTASAEETLRDVVYRMAGTGRTRLPVLESRGSRRVVGIISLNDLLKARVRHLEEEERRETVLTIPFATAPADQR